MTDYRLILARRNLTDAAEATAELLHGVATLAQVLRDDLANRENDDPSILNAYQFDSLLGLIRQSTDRAAMSLATAQERLECVEKEVGHD